MDPEYPWRLHGFEYAPDSLAVRGGPLEAECTVGVIGSRAATAGSIRRTRALCRALVGRGAVVIAGGAIGIDAAAHRAALEAAGRTWAVAATGPEGCSPEGHAELFDAIGSGPGAMLWPLTGRHAHSSAFLRRNRILAMLSDVVVVMQAGKPSGALHAAGWARKLGKPLWVARPPARLEAFAGSRQLLDEGAFPLETGETLLASLVRRRSGRAPTDDQRNTISRENTDILSAISDVPMHLDRIASLARRTAQATAAALLTLALENVVVEGPPGFFRRQK